MKHSYSHDKKVIIELKKILVGIKCFIYLYEI